MKKLICLIMAVTVITALFAIPVSAAEPTITSTPEGAITFPGGANLSWLTDGKIPEADALTATGFNTSGVVLVCNTICTDGTQNPEGTITVELEQAQTVTDVYVTWYHQYDDMIGLPMDNKAIVGASADGVTWTEGAMDIDGEPTSGVRQQVTASGALPTPVINAKYIRVSWNHGPSPFTTGNNPKVVWEWVSITEIGTTAPGTAVVVTPDDIDTADIPEGAAVIAQPGFNAWNTAGLATIETAIDNIKNHNPQGCTAAILRPTDSKEVYTVVELYKELPLEVADGYFTYEKGDIAVMMSAGNAAWDSFNCLEAGDEVTFLGYDIENMVHASNAVAYFTDKYVAPDEPSEEPSEEPAEPSEEPSVPAEDSEPAESVEVPAESDTASTADGDEDKGGCGSAIAATAVVITSILGLAVGFTRKRK